MRSLKFRICRWIFLSLLSNFLIACTSMQHINESQVIDDNDPWETTNRSIYKFNDSLDKNILKPVSTTYIKITPEPFRIGATNFFGNLRYFNVILNNSLQGKLDQGASDLLRFIVNSSLGVGGLFDVATSMGLVSHEEDVGQTLAVWGIPQGPYVNIPAMGPNTVRNLPNYVSKYFLDPFAYWVSLNVTAPLKVLEIINSRANLLNASNLVDNAAIDPYSFTREAYLNSRKNMIYDENLPVENYDDIFNDLDFGEEMP
jgi:phospholipid-binding lipoprotein MlaA